MDYTLNDFLRCPNHDCEEPDVGVDYYHDSQNVFFNFRCINCEHGALEDDFRWHVTCPNCLDNDVSGGVDRVNGEINDEEGLIQFNCVECGASTEEFVRTKWDSDGSDPKFEPNTY